MDTAALLLAALVLLAVVWFVSDPLRRSRGPDDDLEDPRIADLEARKEAKYREIRDAELDRAAGKLSERDWRPLDAELRAEAIEILDELERLRAESPGERAKIDG